MKTLTLVIPVYNEEKRINETLKSLDSYTPPLGVILEQIRFVNDGSTDATLALLSNWKKSRQIKAKVEILSYDRNKGRGYALRRAFENVTSEYAAYIDADMAIPLSNLAKLTPLMKSGYDLIAGSKKKPGRREFSNRGLLRRVFGYAHSVCVWVVLGVFYWDFQGGLKMFSRRLVKEVVPICTIDGWGFDMEVIFWAEKLGFKCTEVSVSFDCIESESRVLVLRDIKRAFREMFQVRMSWLRYTLLGHKAPDFLSQQ